MADALAETMPPRYQPEPAKVSTDYQLDRLEVALEPSDRVAFLRLRRGDWEARTMDGDVGRGDTLGAATRDLIEQLDG